MDFLSDVNSKKQMLNTSAEKIVISKEDVETIVKELQVQRSTAEKALRKSKGDLKQALYALIASPSYT